MEERERSGKLSPEIYVYATSKHFLNVYDALRISKVKIEIAGYDPATNRQTGCANAWLDADDARLLAHLVCHRLFLPVTGGRWERFGGSQRDDGTIESRHVSIERDEGENGRFARFPYRITIANGPGKKTATGGVSPAGEPSSRQSMRVPETDLIKLMLCVGDYIRAYETAHHHRIVAQRVNDLRDKLAERSSATHGSPGSPQPPGHAAADTRRGSPSTWVAGAPPSGGRPMLRAMPGGKKEAAPVEPAGVARLG